VRFAVTTLGCKANQYEGGALAATLRRLGLLQAAEGEPVDLAAVNTCCVTATAMRKSRRAIRRAARQWPRAALIILGCYSDYDARGLRGLLSSLGVHPERVLLAGHHGDLAGNIERFVRAISAPVQAATPSLQTAEEDERLDRPRAEGIKARRSSAVKRNASGTANLAPLDRFDGHQRAFVKVQDGCDAFCAYCVVPFTRPRVWSRSVDEIEAECRQLAAAGKREIVLSGVFLGAFGRPTAVRRRWSGKPSPLPGLLRRAQAIEGLWRVRLSSLEPLDLTDDLLAACRELPNFAPHFHLPLQSGSPRILRRMNRQYGPEEFRRSVDRLRAAFDRPAITTDIIVGFPSETDEDFTATMEMARYTGFSRMHVFPFSAIEGTAAWTYRREAPPPRVVKARVRAITELGHRLATEYGSQFVGQTAEAVVEEPPAHGRFRLAMTDRHLTVAFEPRPGDGDLTGRILRMKITAASAEGLQGTPT
jgi:threonylcarbamoyladenosine tRNA methylthiotransferase MtaB